MQTRLLMALFIPFDLPGWDRVSFQSPVKITAVISRPELHRWGSSTSRRQRSKTSPVLLPALLAPSQLLGRHCNLAWPRGDGELNLQTGTQGQGMEPSGAGKCR